MQQLSLLGGRLCAHCGQHIPSSRRSIAKYCSDACNKKASNGRCSKRVKAYLAAYYQANKGPSKRGPKKHENESDRRLKRNYGISLQDWRGLRESQGGKCCICSIELDEQPSHRTHVDHCHETGTVRGILCTKCNTGLGSFGDDIGRLEAAVRYLSERKLGTATKAA